MEQFGVAIGAVDKVSVAELNRLAHEARRDAGELGKSQMFHTMDCKTADDRIEFSEGDRVVFRKNARELDVYNRNQGMIETIRGNFLDVRADDGRLISMDSTSDKWKYEGKEEGFGLQHSYATSVYSSQGLNVGNVYLKDSLSLNRASAGVGMSRHKETVQAYVDKQVRYESKMRSINPDQWHHIDKFSRDECLARIATAWSSDHGKDSTLDFSKWETATGAQVDVKTEVAIANINNARDLAKTEIDRIRQASKHPQLRNITPRQDFIFQQSTVYRLPEPQPTKESLHAGINRLVKDAIEVEIISEAGKQGFIRFDNDGLVIFCGRRPGDQALVNVVGGSKDVDQLRDRFPPILVGDSSRVDVVKTGQDALALWSLQDKSQVARSTVIVSSGKEEALSLRHTRELIEQASHLKCHQGSLTTKQYENIESPAPIAKDAEEMSIVDANKVAAQEAAARAAAEAAARAANARRSL